jgi:hypothetical protein
VVAYRWSKTSNGLWALQIVERFPMKPIPQHIENTRPADWLRFCADEETGQHEMEPHERAKLEQAYEETLSEEAA